MRTRNPTTFIFALLVTVVLVVSCFSSTLGLRSHLPRARRVASMNASMPVLYEISTRPYLYSLSQQLGHSVALADIPMDEWMTLRDKGVDVVWMMGVWKLGEYGLKIDQSRDYSNVLPGYTKADIIGSPYAIVQYSVNPEIGSDNDLIRLRETLNHLGMQLWVDFVPNHSAVDCPYVNSTPSYYVHAPKGTPAPYDPNKYLPSGIAFGADPYSGAWIDTAQFNYWNEDLIRERIEELKQVASMSDGIRCDMAMLLLNDVIEQTWGNNLASWGYSRPSQEFWKRAISEVKSIYPNVKFMAEAYWDTQPLLQELGFDFTYDKTLYDRLTSGNLDDIRQWISSNSLSYLDHSAHFIENHDEARAVTNFGGVTRADAAALVSYTIPGLKFNNWGQWLGYQYRLDVHLRRARSEDPNPTAVSFYDKFLPIVDTDIFRFGTWNYIPVDPSGSGWRLMAWRWSYLQQKRLVVINYSDQQAFGNVVVADAFSPSGEDTITITDLLSGASYQRSASQMRGSGLGVIIDPWWAQIFTY